MEPRELEVCQVTSNELMHDFILEYCQTMKWAHGKMDHQLYWVAGPRPGAGVYVGKLDGQPITAVGIFQHNDSYAFVGFYFCKEEYRGKGYGFKTWKVARALFHPDTNLGLDAEEPAIHLYEREGFRRAWDITLYSISVSSALEAYTCCLLPEGITLEPCAAVDFQKLKLYTEDVIGFSFDRPSVLEKWISLPTHIALAAVKNGEIVGFAVMRESDEYMYRLAPLLADSGDIARSLLLELAKKVGPERRFILNAPDINAEAKNIAAEMKGVFYSLNVRMYSKCELPVNKKKYFGIFLPNLTG